MIKSIDRPWEESFRLPENVIPEHYELYMHPDLSAKTFSGRVTISLTSQEPRDHFLVHSQWLTITNTSLVSKKGSQSQVRSHYQPGLPCHTWIMLLAVLCMYVTYAVTQGLNVKASYELCVNVFFVFLSVAYIDNVIIASLIVSLRKVFCLL